MKTTLPFLAAALLLLTGCIFSGREYTAPATFDLGTEFAQCSIPVNRLRVTNESGADRRFLYRAKNNRMTWDEFNLWMLEPELLFRRALKSVFAARNTSGADISCSIDLFEFDISKNNAVLKITYVISKGTKSAAFIYDRKESFISGSSASAAEAMNKCVRAAMENICMEYRVFSEKEKK